jgi:hypothetical protein
VSDKGWTQEEAGWYTHPKLGGVCKEHDGWWWYPSAFWDRRLPGKVYWKVPINRTGPFKTLRQAKMVAQKETQHEW